MDRACAYSKGWMWGPKVFKDWDTGGCYLIQLKTICVNILQGFMLW